MLPAGFKFSGHSVGDWEIAPVPNPVRSMRRTGTVRGYAGKLNLQCDRWCSGVDRLPKGTTFAHSLLRRIP